MLPAALDSSLSTGAMPKGSSSCTAAGAAKKSTLRQGLAVPLLTKTLKPALTEFGLHSRFQDIEPLRIACALV